MKTIICLSAYNRPVYFQEVITALERCNGIENYPIICSLDGGDEKNQLKNQNVLENSNLEIEYRNQADNLGCAGNMGYVLSWAFNEEEADRVIVVEDDVVLAESALNFVSRLLERYEDDERVFSVTMMSSNKRDNLAANQVNALDWFNCCGFATWKRVWEEIDSEGWFGISKDFAYVSVPHQWNKAWLWNHIRETHFDLKGSWATPMANYWIKGRVCIEPAVSRIQNIGEVGTFTGITSENNAGLDNTNIYEETVKFHTWIGDGSYEVPKLEDLIFPTEEELDHLYYVTQIKGGVVK